MRADIFKIKKTVSKLCLTAALLLSAVTISTIMTPPTEVYAAEPITISDTITAVMSDDGKTLTFTGTGEIPQLTNIVASHENIENVIIEEGITSLGTSAFQGWTKLQSIQLPNGLTKVGLYVFRYSGLKELTIPKTLTTAPSVRGFLEDSDVEIITFEDGMTKIPDGLCTNAKKLTKVNIPDSVTEIGTSAFDGCTSLAEIDLPNSITKMGNYIFRGCTALAEIKLPANLNTIGYYVFENSAVTEIAIPKSLVSFPGFMNSAFGNSNISTVIFEEGTTLIPQYACLNITKLKNVIIPDSVAEVGSYAFNGCTSLTEIDLPDNLLVISGQAFRGCTSLSSIKLPKNITSIGDYAFTDTTSLKEIVIPKSLSSVSKYNEFTGLEKITFENGMTAIPAYMCQFAKNLATVNIPNSVTEIGGFAFYGCTSLESIILPNSLQTIKQDAFNGCTSLTEITIPDSVTTISTRAFTVSSETITTVKTSNSYVMGINWSVYYNRVVTFIDPAAFQEGLTMTGIVSPITTIDISIPLDSLSFTIDENRNLTAETTQIINNSQYPLDMYILSIESINDAPSIIAKDTYTEKEWNNLSAIDTLKYISISVNDNELYEVFNNTERNHDLAILIGRLKSGFAGAETLDLVPSAQYGKSFFNTEDLVVQYKVVFEVVIP